MVSIPFSDEIKKNVLLWSDRHCCLCEKSCGVDIVIAHLEKPEDNSLDNAIPLCYNCHGKIGRYNPDHPIGTKYKFKELKTRREQIFDKYTSQLVPPIDLKLGKTFYENKTKRVFTHVRHLSDTNPVRLIIDHTPFVDKKKYKPIESRVKNYYNKGLIWNFNPRGEVRGSFAIKDAWIETSGIFGIEFRINVIDVYDRHHNRLPFCYTYIRKYDQWNFEPTSHEEICKYIKDPTE